MFILKFLSQIFLIIVKIRIFLYENNVLKSYKINNVKIISIGNISFGGTGKTPVTIKIAENLMNNNLKTAILLRGYKRKGKEILTVVSDGKRILSDSHKAGDEAILIAKKLKCPVVVSKDRVKGADFISKNFKVDFIILDDGFQHLKLKRDKDIVLITEKSLNEDIALFPCKHYREPLSHLKRSDLVIITKIENLNTIKRKALLLKSCIGKDIFLSNIYITRFKDLKKNIYLKKDSFNKKEVIIFCGIGMPEYFLYLLKKTGIIVKEKFFFKDHYYLKDNDYNTLNKYKNTPIITTEKDAVKIDINKFTNNIYVAETDYSFTSLI